MGPPVRIANMAAEQMRVQLCRGDVGMAQQLLDHPQVRTTIQEMRGKRVSEGVRMYLASETCGVRSCADRRPRRLTAKSPTSVGKQERPRIRRGRPATCATQRMGGAPCGEIDAYGVDRRLSDRHDTLATTITSSRVSSAPIEDKRSRSISSFTLESFSM